MKGDRLMIALTYLTVLWTLAADKPIDSGALLAKYDKTQIGQEIKLLATVTTVDNDKQQPALVDKTEKGVVRLVLERTEVGKLALILPGDTLLVTGRILSLDPDAKIIRIAQCRIIERRKKE
jgi:hypothetical protein